MKLPNASIMILNLLNANHKRFDMKLGYTDFINKYKNYFFAIFIGYLFIYYLIPVIYFNSEGVELTTLNGSFFSMSPIYLNIRGFQLPKTLSDSFANSEYAQHFGLTYKEFCNETIKFYSDAIIASIFAFLILIAIIFMIINFCKTKNMSRLIFIPYLLAIVNNISLYIFYSLTEFNLHLIPINLIVTVIFSLPVFLYCAGFQRFPKIKTSTHKPTDKERIAELEERIKKLEEKDAE